ncbi:MAG: hypothetical protein AAF367_15430 [Pseudomonadota bacterium]
MDAAPSSGRLAAMADWAELSERAVKLTFGIAKIAIGGDRVAAASDVFGLLSDGRNLYSDLTSEAERGFAKSLSAEVETALSAIEKSRDWREGEIDLARIHLDQALSLTRPSPEDIAAANLDPIRLADQMRRAVVGRGGELGHALDAATISRTVFDAAVGTALSRILKDKGFVAEIAPNLWRMTLSQQDQILEEQRKSTLILEQITKERGIAEAALRRIFEAFSTKKSSTVLMMPIPEIVDQVIPMVDEYLQEQARLRVPSGSEKTDRLRAEAADLKDQGKFEAAQTLLNDHATSMAEDAAALARELHQRHEVIAEEYAAAARTMAQISNHAEAAQNSEKAADFARHDPIALLGHQSEAARSWRNYGIAHGNSAALHEAVKIFLDIGQRLVSREKDPDRWAGIQYELGVSLAALSEQLPDRVWLDQALPPLLAASEYWKGKDDAEEYAKTVLHMAQVLCECGHRDNDTEFLDQALDALNAISGIYLREARPYHWAALHHVAGDIYRQIGGITLKIEFIEKSLNCYDAVLEVRTAETVPLDRAMTLRNKASALSLYNVILGTAEPDLVISKLNEADAIYAEVETVLTKRRTPVHWAETLVNRAGVQICLGQRLARQAPFDEAIALCQKALVFFAERDMVSHLDGAQTRIADAIRLRGAVKVA